MGKYLRLAVLLLAAMPAAAEFEVVEEAANFTVYRDDNQIIVLVDGRRGEWRDVAESRAPERATVSTFRSQLSGKDMFYFYLVRTRMLDGEPVCEKFFERPAGAEQRKLYLQIFALAPCGQNL